MISPRCLVIKALILAISNHGVCGDYCEFGLCDTEQYCCGENKCCEKTLELWYFWVGIVVILFAIALAYGIKVARRKWRARHAGRYPYAAILNQNSIEKS